jgi:hypothetical protein
VSSFRGRIGRMRNVLSLARAKTAAYYLVRLLVTNQILCNQMAIVYGGFRDAIKDNNSYKFPFTT